MDPLTILNAISTPFRAVFGGWPLRAYLTAAVMTFGAYHVGHFFGAHGARSQDQHIGHKAQIVGEAVHTDLVKINLDAGQQLSATYKDLDQHTVTVTKEITHYVTVQTDRRYPLSCGFVRVRDAAFLGVDPSAVSSPACQSDDSPAPAGESAFLHNEVQWAEYTHKLEAQNDQLRQLIVAYATEWNDYRGKLIEINHGAK